MNIRELRASPGCTQKEFAQRYGIPFRTVQNWESGSRKSPEYVLNMLNDAIKVELVNHKTTELPTFDHHKQNLPRRRDYIGATAWLKAVQQCIGSDAVFALDEALMCQGSFGGRSDEFLVWVYGDDKLSRYNGVVVLGNHISERCVAERNGLRYTTLNRTIADAFANESILDMQGITEAVSRYYYKHGGSFDGIFVSPEYEERFDALARDAIEYYDS